MSTHRGTGGIEARKAISEWGVSRPDAVDSSGGGGASGASGLSFLAATTSGGGNPVGSSMRVRIALVVWIVSSSRGGLIVASRINQPPFSGAVG